jgi:hypothetical protein
MRKSVLTFFALGALLFDLSLALQAEDLPETSYDESQGAACEHTPLLLTQVLQDSVQRTQSSQKLAFPLQFGSPTRRGEIHIHKRQWSEQLNFFTSTIRAASLRC